MTFTLRREKDWYAAGYDDGADGMPLQFVRGPAGARYRDGWYRGYSDALKRACAAYNRRHGTNFEPRGPY